MKTGWISIHRKIQDNEIWHLDKFSRGQAWIDLILLANHETRNVMIRGNLIKVERGQLIWSERELAKRWRWSRPKVHNFIKMLCNAQQVSIKVTHRLCTHTSILNYDKYQQTLPQTIPQTVPQKYHRPYQNNNVNNVNKRKESFFAGVKPPAPPIPYKGKDLEKYLSLEQGDKKILAAGHAKIVNGEFIPTAFDL